MLFIFIVKEKEKSTDETQQKTRLSTSCSGWGKKSFLYDSVVSHRLNIVIQHQSPSWNNFLDSVGCLLSFPISGFGCNRVIFYCLLKFWYQSDRIIQVFSPAVFQTAAIVSRVEVGLVANGRNRMLAPAPLEARTMALLGSVGSAYNSIGVKSVVK